MPLFSTGLRSSTISRHCIVTSFFLYNFIKMKQCTGILGENWSKAGIDAVWPKQDPSKSGETLRLCLQAINYFDKETNTSLSFEI